MTAENEPSLFLWRLVFIAFTTVFAGAVPMVALSGVPAHSTLFDSGVTVSIILVAVSWLALLLLAPMHVVWSIAFVFLLNGLSRIRYREMISTFVSVVIGNVAVFALMLRGTVPDWRSSAEMGMMTLFKVSVAVGLTWSAFRNEVQT